MLKRVRVAGMAQAGNQRLTLAAIDRLAGGEKRVLADEPAASPGAVAHEVDTSGNRRQRHFRERHAEALLDECLDPRTAVDGAVAGEAEQHEVVDIAAVVPHTQLALDEVVQRVQVHQRIELAQQIADRDPGGLPVVGKQHHYLDEAAILDLALDHLPQDGAVDAVEELAEVELQRIAAGWHGAQSPLRIVGSLMGALADPAGE